MTEAAQKVVDAAEFLAMTGGGLEPEFEELFRESFRHGPEASREVLNAWLSQFSILDAALTAWALETGLNGLVLYGVEAFCRNLYLGQAYTDSDQTALLYAALADVIRINLDGIISPGPRWPRLDMRVPLAPYV